MKLKRKIIKIKTGRAVFLPKQWVDQIEQKHGPQLEVAIQIGDELTVKTILEGEFNECV